MVFGVVKWSKLLGGKTILTHVDNSVSWATKHRAKRVGSVG